MLGAGLGAPISVMALESERLCGLAVSPFSSSAGDRRVRREFEIRWRRLGGNCTGDDWGCLASVDGDAEMALTREALRASRRLEMRLLELWRRSTPSGS